MLPTASQDSVRTTVFIITIGDATFPQCLEAIQRQTTSEFSLKVIQNIHPMSAAFQEMIRRCETEFFIQVDEDMILEPTTVKDMELTMSQVPENVGMICFHLFDVDRDSRIQGIKIYRTAAMQSLKFRDVKACEMDLLEQMSLKGIRWILHPKVHGRHGTDYTPETIYRRYKSMYEKDILEWNDVTDDIRRKATQFQETGDLLALFALMGAVDGIVSVPYADNQEKDFTKYQLKSLDVLRRVFLESHSFPVRYDYEQDVAKTKGSPPIPLEQVMWKSVESLPVSEQTSTSLHQSKRPQDHPHPSRLNGKRILLACNYFWPSVGGVETVVANLGHEFVNQGYQVDIATIALPNRIDSEYQGMHIISLDTEMTRKLGAHNYPSLCWELHELLATGKYDACVLFANPENWLMISLLLGEISPRTKLFIQFLVNKEGFDRWGNDLRICERVTMILQKAHGALALTRQGIDATFMSQAEIVPIFLPNATTPVVPIMDFRETYRISRNAFLIIHVANIWKVKNHLGLIRTLSPVPHPWKLVLIGMPFDKGGQEEMENAEQIAEALKGRPDILYIPGLPEVDIAAAMKAANVVVLASHAEISPMAILESMSYGTPWLATPECGDVTAKAGGIVAPLNVFRAILQILCQYTDLCESLGMLGYAHWEACFSWDVVKKGWIELVEQGHPSSTFDMPQEIIEKMNVLQTRLNEILECTDSLSSGEPSINFQEPIHKDSSFSPRTSLPLSRVIGG